MTIGSESESPWRRLLAAIMLLFVCGLVSAQATGSAEAVRELLSIDGSLNLDGIETSDAQVERVEGSVLRVRTGHHAYEEYKGRWPGITLKPARGAWDLSEFQRIAVEVRNPDSQSVTVYCLVLNPLSNREQYRDRVIQGETMNSLNLEPGESGTLRVEFVRSPFCDENMRFTGMRGLPPVMPLTDPSRVTALEIFVYWPGEDNLFDILAVRAEGRYNPKDEERRTTRFFPMVDEFGQYIHRDWPGKTHDPSDLERRRLEEQHDLDTNNGPGERDMYGGWSAGPRSSPTGFFSVKRYHDKWWFVDPGGYLFWSHGINCVEPQGTTPVTGREPYFKETPFLENGCTDFMRANLVKKYGENWQTVVNEIAHRRLKSWGMNTIANWSSPAICKMRETPYTAHINGSGRELSHGFPDPFDPDFRQSLRQSMARHKDKTANDPWCIGYFSGNELRWGDGISLALCALASPADQPAKKAFLEQLKTKYASVDSLNAVWGTHHASWDAILQCREWPEKEKAKAHEDLAAFYSRLAEEHFRICREEIKAVAPNQLYLGCRFCGVGKNVPASRAAAKYCDVLSVNIYDRRPDDFLGECIPPDIDVPILVTEFMFTGTDRGMFDAGLQRDVTQEQRAFSYSFFVLSALRNRRTVGTHYFQYTDQPLTGRGPDGENYQLGFLDVCDTTYPEIANSARDVGYTMYEYRLLDGRW